ncbi:hypothetical protein [Campylobacter majalis]|uniref:hypothetical protein n=1 Tax=Campylobacter majalis TaxID=2790656 RepID=UPI003D687BF3
MLKIHFWLCYFLAILFFGYMDVKAKSMEHKKARAIHFSCTLVTCVLFDNLHY